MIQQRKKDFLQRIIEEFFYKLQQLISKGENKAEIQLILKDCFLFYTQNFNIKRIDTANTLIEKIKEPELIEGYVRFLITEYENIDIKYRENLLTALTLIEYLQQSDKDYSWERVVMREDILRMLEENDKERD